MSQIPNDPNPYQTPETQSPPTGKPSLYANYENVPWFRRSGVNSVFVLVGFFCCSPFLWVTCIMLMTGDIYYNRQGPDGTLETWSVANKVVAWVLLLVNLAAVAFSVMGQAG